MCNVEVVLRAIVVVRAETLPTLRSCVSVMSNAELCNLCPNVQMDDGFVSPKRREAAKVLDIFSDSWTLDIGYETDAINASLPKLTTTIKALHCHDPILVVSTTQLTSTLTTHQCFFSAAAGASVSGFDIGPLHSIIHS